jgi:predicted double-glycine peptidase
MRWTHLSSAAKHAAGGVGRFLFAGAMVLFAACARPAQAGDVVLATPTTGSYALKLTSFADLKFSSVIRQQYDYSCGSAALATLLRYHYHLPVDEATVFRAMFNVGDQANIEKLGFSLLDMKKYLASIGYEADGYRLGLDQLSKVGVPAIALIQIGSYKHFVVIKGVVGNHVLVGDSALGLRVLSAEEFLEEWNGIVFIVHSAPVGSASPVFNNAEEWKRWADASPLSAAVVVAPLAPFLSNLRVLYQIEPNQILPNPLLPNPIF